MYNDFYVLYKITFDSEIISCSFNYSNKINNQYINIIS